MHVIKDFVSWLKGKKHASYYYDVYNILELVVFLTLCIISIVLFAIIFLFLVLSLPLWFLPWLVFTCIRGRKEEYDSK